jgi:hypothetical protein
MHGAMSQKAAEGATEVGAYNSGNDRTMVNTFGTSTTNASVSGGPGYASGTASTRRVQAGGSRPAANMSVVIADVRVNRVNYSGPRGGILTGGEQCAFAVQNCTR